MAAGRSCAVLLFCFIYSVSAYSEPGVFDLTLSQRENIGDFQRSMYNGTEIIVKLTCPEPQSTKEFTVRWWLWKADCLQAFQGLNNQTVGSYKSGAQMNNVASNGAVFIASSSQLFQCNKDHYVISDPGTLIEATIPTVTEGKADDKDDQDQEDEDLEGAEKLDSSASSSSSSPASKSTTNQVTEPKNIDNKQVPNPNEQAPKDEKKEAENESVAKDDKNQASQVATKQKRDVEKKRKVSRNIRNKRDEQKAAEEKVDPPKEKDTTKSNTAMMAPTDDKKGTPVYTTKSTDIFLFLIEIDSDTDVQMNVQMKTSHGYLSPIDWPNLPFYGLMCVLYVLYGIAWLVMLAMNWRDLLRIQFWIGAVILLGMLEKAVYFGEYESLNSTGQSVGGALIFAELVSALKRTLARMLVIIVSLGYGIVKPRLGADQNKVVGIGIVFFILSAVEGCMRVAKNHGERTNGKDMLGLLFTVTLLEVYICYWIFTSLVQTTRVLRLRRNVVKLSLYRHFTNTLVFAVLASLAFMVWSMSQHRFVHCLSDWQELWVDEAFWHMLFCVVLLVIIILWRPSVNNQRYAFSPLLDSVEEEDEDDETPMSDAYDGMNKREQRGKDELRNVRNPDKKKDKVDDDLKWIDENIPASVADAALPSLLDSDEEIVTTKFEVSKME